MRRVWFGGRGEAGAGGNILDEENRAKLQRQARFGTQVDWGACLKPRKCVRT